MNILYLHLALMSSVFLLSLLAVIIAKFLRKKNWWLKTHKLMNQIKTILAISGFIIAIIMVANFGMKHFSTIHGIIGLIVFILILLQSSAGFIITNPNLSNLNFIKNTKISRILRIIHKKSGLIIIFLILINLIFGISKIV